MSVAKRQIEVKKTKAGYCGSFFAMASPCELLLDTDDQILAHKLTEVAANEAWRIESTYSRYNQTNIIHKIHHADGQPVEVDQEFCELLNFADQCYRISNGLFDITSGVLREIWKFDGSSNVPSRKQAKALLSRIGWNKVTWQAPFISLPEGMQIDLGGFGKEFAVDRAAQLISKLTQLPFLLNFGGDLYASKPPLRHNTWQVGIAQAKEKPAVAISIKTGAIATSGDANRFLLRNGIRYPHVLNPRTGWPVMGAPSSITVIADTCIQAGFLATLAMLNGKDAEHFLAAQGVIFYLY